MAQMQAIDITKASGPKPGEKAAPSLEQMKSLASQFESVLLGQMMRQMRESMFETGDDKENSMGFSTAPLADQIYSELSLALSKSGGLGLGQALGGALARQAAPTEADSIKAEGLLGPLGAVSSPFGMRRDPFDGDLKVHKGTDIPMPVGTDVFSAAAGKVESVGEVEGYGLTVVVSHAGGVKTRYAHLSEATVKAGDGVTKGQVIAKSGNTGRTTGPHLHFEVIEDGRQVDPALVTR